MNINTIKHIVESYTLDQLHQAEQDLLAEKPLAIAIDGTDEGEQMTHILAALFCQTVMAEQQISLQQAVRLYSQRVRDSIN